jgi:hypothetical protein
VDLTEPTQDRNVRLAAGVYVCVEISDNGMRHRAGGDAADFRAVFHDEGEKRIAASGWRWLMAS